MRQCSPARRVGATRFGGFLEPKQSGENGGGGHGVMGKGEGGGGPGQASMGLEGMASCCERRRVEVPAAAADGVMMRV
jgi:hypothetical protein